jgi:hypothetical protein
MVALVGDAVRVIRVLPLPEVMVLLTVWVAGL